MTLQPYKKQLILCLFAYLFVQTIAGQDSTATHRIPIKPTTDFDQRFYYTPGEIQNVWGYRVGVLINDKYKLGIGGYYMNKTSDQDVPTNSLSRTTTDSYSLHKKLYLGTVYYEPYLMRRRLWETSLVFETGYGRTVTYSIDEKNNQTLNSNNALIIPAGAGLSVNFKMPALFHLQCLRWIGINAMAGYRTCIYQQDKQYSYNGAYWSLSGAVFLDRMFEDFNTWKKEKSVARNKRIAEITY